MKKFFLSLLFFILHPSISASDNSTANTLQKSSLIQDSMSCVDNRIANFFAEQAPYFQDFNAVKNYVKNANADCYIKKMGKELCAITAQKRIAVPTAIKM